MDQRKPPSLGTNFDVVATIIHRPMQILEQTFTDHDLRTIQECYEPMSAKHPYITKAVLLKYLPETLVGKLEQVVSKLKGLNLVGLIRYMLYEGGLPKCLCGAETVLKYRPVNKSQETIRCQPAKCNKGLSCSTMNQHRNGKIRETSLERYGVTSPRQAQEVKEKVVRTCLLKYGETNPGKVERFRAQGRHTMLERYGVDNPSKCPKMQEDRIQASLLKHGVRHPMQLGEIRDKQQQTTLERYGVRHAAQNLDIKAKTKRYFLEKYGQENPFSNPQVQEKIRKYNIRTYGVPYSAQSKEFQAKMKQAVRDKYGVTSVFKDPHVQEKIKLVMLEKYGVERPLQNIDLFRKFQKSAKNYKELTIQGQALRLQGYEPQALLWLLSEKNLSMADVQVSMSDKKDLKISYTSQEGSPAVYYPDFLIRQTTIVEVKSTFTLLYSEDVYNKVVLKAQACRRQGYTFMLLLVVPKGRKSHAVVELPEDWYSLSYLEILIFVESLGIKFNIERV